MTFNPGQLRKVNLMTVLPVVAGLALAVAPFGQGLAFILQWGSLGAGDGQFNTPVGVTTDRDGKVYVTDYGNARVEVFTGDGTYLTQWTTLAHGFSTPVGVAVAANGDVYITEQTMDRIQVFSGDGTFLRLWGSPGSGPGQFDGPYGIALGPDGTVYVADTYNERIQAFAGDGTFITKWATDPSDPQPISIATDVAGRVYVGAGFSVQVYSSSGSYITKHAMPCCYPRGIAVTSDRIYVAATNRIVEFTSAGAFVTETGTLGAGPGQFNDPTALCVDMDGHILVTDSLNNRVQKLGDLPIPTHGPTWGHVKALYR